MKFSSIKPPGKKKKKTQGRVFRVAVLFSWHLSLAPSSGVLIVTFPVNFVLLVSFGKVCRVGLRVWGPWDTHYAGEQAGTGLSQAKRIECPPAETSPCLSWGPPAGTACLCQDTVTSVPTPQATRAWHRACLPLPQARGSFCAITTWSWLQVGICQAPLEGETLATGSGWKQNHSHPSTHWPSD